jgi:hypothetical protein
MRVKRRDEALEVPHGLPRERMNVLEQVRRAEWPVVMALPTPAKWAAPTRALGDPPRGRPFPSAPQPPRGRLSFPGGPFLSRREELALRPLRLRRPAQADVRDRSGQRPHMMCKIKNVTEFAVSDGASIRRGCLKAAWSCLGREGRTDTLPPTERRWT